MVHTQQLEQLEVLLGLVEHDHVLLDVLAHDAATAHRDLDGLAHSTARQRLHLLGKRGREHDHLSIGTNVVEDLGHLRLEAHVVHAVRLVEHNVRDATQVRDATVVRG